VKIVHCGGFPVPNYGFLFLKLWWLGWFLQNPDYFVLVFCKKALTKNCNYFEFFFSKLSKFFKKNCQNSPWKNCQISSKGTVKIVKKKKLSKFFKKNCQNSPWKNCQNSPKRTVKIVQKELSKFFKKNCQNSSKRTVKISLFQSF
jgi:hypothetical protein